MLNSLRVRQIFIFKGQLFHGSGIIRILIKFPWPLELKYPHIVTHPSFTTPRDWFYFSSAGLICIEKWSYGKYTMPGVVTPGCVIMWGYFNSKGQGNFIRMRIIPDPWNNAFRNKIYLTLREFNIGVSWLMHPVFYGRTFIYLWYIIHSQRKFVSLKVGFFSFFLIKALRSISKRWFFIPLFRQL